MGMSRLMKYRVEVIDLVGNKGVFGWQVSEYGKANEKNLAKFASKIRPQVIEARIVEQKEAKVIAEWRDGNA